MFHGTTETRAQHILAHGFHDKDAREPSTVYLTPHADLAHRYAEGRVKADGAGSPAVLRINNVRGVSATETGYGKPHLNREAGADYMAGHSETIVLNPAAIHGVTRHTTGEM